MQIEILLHNLGIPVETSNILAALTTVNDVLAQGVSTSPLLANVICHEMDDDFSELAERHECVYTRYVDDLSFSGSISTPSKLEVAGILNKHNFSLAEDKFRKTVSGQSHFVTGLSVSDKQPHVPKMFKRKIRQEVYYCGKYGIEEHAVRSRYPTIERCVNAIDGRISYLRSIEPQLGMNLHCAWKEILERENRSPTYGYADRIKLRTIYHFIDESIVEHNGKRYLSMCLASMDDTAVISRQINSFYKLFVSDPYVSGRKSKLVKKGFHYSDDTQEIKTDYIKLISQFPFRAFIAIKQLPNDSEYISIYYDLARILVYDRLVSRCNYISEFVFENNPKISIGELRIFIDKLCVEICERKQRRISVAPKIFIGSKKDYPICSVADYCLGATNDYIFGDKSQLSRLRYERIRDKIRLIVDCNTGVRYSRNNPLSSDLFFNIS